MSQLQRAELAGILFQEINGYVPEIEIGLSTLHDSVLDQNTLNEVYRLFHNIKGAASQVAFTGLSNSAAICEAVVADMLETDRPPVGSQLDFLDTVNGKIREFCSLEDKSVQAEESLFSDTISFFQQLMKKCGPENPIILPDYIHDWISTDEQSIPHDNEKLELTFTDLGEVRSECLASLRSIFPLLQELTDCSSAVEHDFLPEYVLNPMAKAVTTLAECSLAAGLVAQHGLLSSFLIILEKLGNNQTIGTSNASELLKDFLSYLEMIFSLPPDEGELITARVQNHFSSFCDLLTTGTLPASAPSFELEEDDESTFAHFTADAIDLDDEILPEILFSELESENITDLPIEPVVDTDVETRLSEDEIELQAIFKDECDEHLQTIAEEIHSLENAITCTTLLTPALREPLSSMRRSVHTLKGAAAITGFDTLASCSHGLEDLLDWLFDTAQDISPDDIAIIAEAIGTIETLSQTGCGTHSIDTAAATEAVLAHLKLRTRQLDESGSSPVEQSVPLTGVAELNAEIVDTDIFFEESDIQEEVEASVTAYDVEEGIHQDSHEPSLAPDTLLEDTPLPLQPQFTEEPDNSAADEELELLEIFQAECEEHLQTINTELNTLESEILQRKDLIFDLRECVSRMRRGVHTLKGAAAMTGFDEIATCAHSLEDLLDWVHDESKDITPDDVTVIADAIDTIESLAQLSVEETAPDVIAISESIMEHLKQRKLAIEYADEVESTSADIAQPVFEAIIAENPLESDVETAGDTDVTDGFEFFENIDEADLVTTLPDESFSRSTSQQNEESELLVIFQSECDEHLQTINEELNALNADVQSETKLTEQLRESVSRMRRGVHTLKGAAAMTGFDDLASCAHSLEDLLDWLHDDGKDILPSDIKILADAIDTIENLSQSEGNTHSDEVAAVSQTIREHLTNRSTRTQYIETFEIPNDLASEGADVADTPDSLTQAERLFHKAPESEQESSNLPTDTGNIRVKLSDLDELVNIEGELVVARGSIEKLLDRFSDSLDELNTIKDTLRRKSQDLEVGFEAQSLYGFGSGPLSGSGSSVQESASTLSDFDPIELDRYSQLNLIIRSLNEISIDVNAIYSEMTTLGSSLQGQVSKQQLAMGVMQEKLMRIRMTPLSSISRMLFRTVRQTANRLEKNVQLTVTGEDVYMDRFIWTRTVDPLMHILRNCVDHGIEDDQTRQIANKPATGQITIEANQHGRFVVLKISDDGSGVNTEQLRSRLIRDGIISATESIADKDLLRYIFRPSVSTRDDISQTSGRGVGLDVVLRNIQELRGSVQIINTPSKGVTFELSIPITLSVNRAIIIELSERQFAVPIQEITEVRKFKESEIIVGDEQQAMWNGQHIPLIQLAPQLQLPSIPVTNGTTDALTLIVNTADGHIAMQIDRVEEQREIVIKDLGSHLRYVRGINGVTLTGEGTIIPILNVRELSTSKQAAIQTVEHIASVSTQMEPLKVLVVDDSISVRYSITRLVEGQSWKAFQAVDGIDALERLETLTPDVIILDIEMPRMNGYEFMGIIRNNDNYMEIPVIMLTSRASEKHRKKAEELGVNHYMTKPFQEDEFIDLLSSIENS